MRITVLMVTHNRLEYTRRALERLLRSEDVDFELVVWDNASSDATPGWLTATFAGDERVTLVLSHVNRGVVHPMNAVWGWSQSPLVAKIDNDTVVPGDLLARLRECHLGCDRLGVVSGCHFRHEDVGDRVQPVWSSDGVRLLRQPHVGGCAVMMRRSLFEAMGPILAAPPPGRGPFAENGWSRYQERLHRAGCVNGYPLPLVFVEHMEDLRSAWTIDTPEYRAYKQAMRGMSLEQYTREFYIEGAARYFGSCSAASRGGESPEERSQDGSPFASP